MDSLTLLRQGVLFAHTVAFAIALSAVLREDFALLRTRCIDLHRLANTARTLGYALAVLWVSGLALVLFDIGFDAQKFVTTPKIAAKLLVVLALTTNGFALHTLAFPVLRAQQALDRFSLVLPVTLGAISTASWLYASFIGVSRAIAPAMSFMDFMTLYGVSLIAAIAAAMLIVHSRVARVLIVKC